MSELGTDQPAAQELVAAERALAPKVAVFAIVAALLPIIAVILQTSAGTMPKNTIGMFPFYDQHGSIIIAGAAISAISYLAAAVPIVFLMKATTARGGKVPRFAPNITIIAAVLLALGNLVFNINLVQTAHRFVNESGITYQQTKDLFTALQKNPVGIAGLLGVFGFTFGFVMSSVNAMRVGLLPRFLGYVGVLAGVMPLLLAMLGGGQTGGLSSVVQTFWLLAVAVIIVGRWRFVELEAWTDGQAHPWPTAAQTRAAAAEANGSD